MGESSAPDFSVAGGRVLIGRRTNCGKGGGGERYAPPTLRS